MCTVTQSLANDDCSLITGRLKFDKHPSLIVIFLSMLRGRRQPLSFLCWIVTLTYLSLTIWMHIWTLEAGVPYPGEPNTNHHQVCTWIGTSGEASLVAEGLPMLSRTAGSYIEPTPYLVPVLAVSASSLQARAPPHSVLLASPV